MSYEGALVALLGNSRSKMIKVDKWIQVAKAFIGNIGSHGNQMYKVEQREYLQWRYLNIQLQLVKNWSWMLFWDYPDIDSKWWNCNMEWSWIMIERNAEFSQEEEAASMEFR